MRIVAGLYGGRRLSVPKGRDVRPTSDKVRGAMFNTLNGYIDFNGARVLDAFCGTGALGLEAVSRGASHVLFWDKSKDSIGLARDNSESLGVVEQCVFKVCDASKVHLNRGAAFDLVFLDPPYYKGFVDLTLKNLLDQGAFASGAICVLETEKHLAIHVPQGFEVLKDKQYGDTHVTYLRYK